MQQGHPISVGLEAIDNYLDLPLLPTNDFNRGDPMDAGKTILYNLVCCIIDFFQVSWGRNGQVHNGHGIDIEFYNYRVFRILRKVPADGIYFVLHLHGCNIRTLLQFEFDNNYRHILTAGTPDILDITYGGDYIFNLFGDLSFHFFRTGSRIDGGDRNHREFHPRKQVDNKTLVGKQAQHDKGSHHHGGKNRSLHCYTS